MVGVVGVGRGVTLCRQSVRQDVKVLQSRRLASMCKDGTHVSNFLAVSMLHSFIFAFCCLDALIFAGAALSFYHRCACSALICQRLTFPSPIRSAAQQSSGLAI